MPVNPFFNHLTSFGESKTHEDLIIESIKMYGLEVYYLPRTLIAEDGIFGEDILSKFKNAYQLEMYVKSVDGFEGEGTFLSKFNIEIRDEITFTISQRRFREEIPSDDTSPVTESPGTGRPNEGDLIYFPINGHIFEVKHVEHEAMFYPFGKLPIYDIQCELFEYSHERIDTGIEDIDILETRFSGDSMFLQLTTENSLNLTTENGEYIIQEEYDIGDTDLAAENSVFESEKVRLDFIDFSEINPFSESP